MITTAQPSKGPSPVVLECADVSQDLVRAELVDLLASLELARDVAAKAAGTPSAGTNYRLRMLSDPNPAQGPQLELVMERLDSEGPLVQELNRHYSAGHEFTNVACRVHTWLADGREIMLRADPDTLVFTISPLAQ